MTNEEYSAEMERRFAPRTPEEIKEKIAWTRRERERIEALFILTMRRQGIGHLI